jgi:hypothetical protein
MQKFFAEFAIKCGRVKFRQQSLCCSSFNQQIVAAAPHFMVQTYPAGAVIPFGAAECVSARALRA